MGNLDQIELLEEYIEDFGKELKSIKKASEYLKLIEQFQEEVSRTSIIMTQSNESMSAHQELTITKLSLYQSILQGIEHKQKSLEESQNKTLSEFIVMDQKYENHMKVLKEDIDTLIIRTEENKTLIEAVSKDQKEQLSILFKKLNLTMSVLMGVNVSLGIAIVLLLLFGK